MKIVSDPTRDVTIQGDTTRWPLVVSAPSQKPAWLFCFPKSGRKQL